MKCSETWLREWVNPSLPREALCDALTMAGLEVEELAPVAKPFSHVVVGQVMTVEKHQESDRLTLCEVDVGESSLLKIVCGASNVRQGIRVPVAMINAVLPNGMEIKSTTIRGAVSEGMLCSSTELGLSEESQGLMILPEDAPIGEDIRKYLLLDDYTIDVSLTPNRGDCLSVRGLSREISAITTAKINLPKINPIEARSKNTLPVYVFAKAECPRYVGRMIQGINATAETPVWLKERLSRSGIRSISIVVDVTNYVMLELGQPLHAFDLDKINGQIQVRISAQNEKISLLDGTDKVLDQETLVIADELSPLAIAGVMGGLDSSVTLETKNIFLESAFFSPATIARQRQTYQLNSDSAHRFERGVDPTIQREAIERATKLIIEIAGGVPGEIVEESSESNLPGIREIQLALSQVSAVLGMEISANDIEKIFKSLHFDFKKVKDGMANDEAWIVTVPSYRFDLTIPEDLIEEIARLYGYDRIPTYSLSSRLQATVSNQPINKLHKLKQLMSDLGYHEIITYSFVDSNLQNLLDPHEDPVTLLNPMSAEMGVMRTNLWPGLLSTMLYNKSRQQNRIRLFETGLCFLKRGDQISQEPKVAGLMTGYAYPEQWGITARSCDFYDMKGDVENIIRSACGQSEITFKPANHPALHPGRTAEINLNDKKIGIVGDLHPSVKQAMDVSDSVILFEIDQNMIEMSKKIDVQEISKFPEIRRDIAILVKHTIPSKDIQDTIKSVAGNWLKDVFIFDVYCGKGISPDVKSIAVGLIFQHPTRTLVDDEIADLTGRIVAALTGQLGAELRS